MTLYNNPGDPAIKPSKPINDPLWSVLCLEDAKKEKERLMEGNSSEDEEEAMQRIIKKVISKLDLVTIDVFSNFEGPVKILWFGREIYAFTNFESLETQLVLS